MMIGVNVIFSPCFSWKLFLTLFLHRTTLVISASTNEVTCGEVCTEFTMWSAISFLMRSISMISSPADGVILGVAVAAGAFGAAAGAAAGVAAGAGAAAGAVRPPSR